MEDPQHNRRDHDELSTPSSSSDDEFDHGGTARKHVGARKNAAQLLHDRRTSDLEREDELSFFYHDWDHRDSAPHHQDCMQKCFCYLTGHPPKVQIESESLPLLLRPEASRVLEIFLTSGPPGSEDFHDLFHADHGSGAGGRSRSPSRPLWRAAADLLSVLLDESHSFDDLCSPFSSSGDEEDAMERQLATLDEWEKKVLSPTRRNSFSFLQGLTAGTGLLFEDYLLARTKDADDVLAACGPLAGKDGWRGVRWLTQLLEEVEEEDGEGEEDPQDRGSSGMVVAGRGGGGGQKSTSSTTAVGGISTAAPGGTASSATGSDANPIAVLADEKNRQENDFFLGTSTPPRTPSTSARTSAFPFSCAASPCCARVEKMKITKAREAQRRGAGPPPAIGQQQHLLSRVRVILREFRNAALAGGLETKLAVAVALTLADDQAPRLHLARRRLAELLVWARRDARTRDDLEALTAWHHRFFLLPTAASTSFAADVQFMDAYSKLETTSTHDLAALVQSKFLLRSRNDFEVDYHHSPDLFYGEEGKTLANVWSVGGPAEERQLFFLRACHALRRPAVLLQTTSEAEPRSLGVLVRDADTKSWIAVGEHFVVENDQPSSRSTPNNPELRAPPASEEPVLDHPEDTAWHLQMQEKCRNNANANVNEATSKSGHPYRLGLEAEELTTSPYLASELLRFQAEAGTSRVYAARRRSLPVHAIASSGSKDGSHCETMVNTSSVPWMAAGPAAWVEVDLGKRCVIEAIHLDWYARANTLRLYRLAEEEEGEEGEDDVGHSSDDAPVEDGALSHRLGSPKTVTRVGVGRTSNSDETTTSRRRGQNKSLSPDNLRELTRERGDRITLTSREQEQTYVHVAGRDPKKINEKPGGRAGEHQLRDQDEAQARLLRPRRENVVAYPYDPPPGYPSLTPPALFPWTQRPVVAEERSAEGRNGNKQVQEPQILPEEMLRESREQGSTGSSASNWVQLMRVSSDTSTTTLSASRSASAEVERTVLRGSGSTTSTLVKARYLRFEFLDGTPVPIGDLRSRSRSPSDRHGDGGLPTDHRQDHQIGVFRIAFLGIAARERERIETLTQSRLGRGCDLLWRSVEACAVNAAAWRNLFEAVTVLAEEAEAAGENSHPRVTAPHDQMMLAKRLTSKRQTWMLDAAQRRRSRTLASGGGSTTSRTGGGSLGGDHDNLLDSSAVGLLKWRLFEEFGSQCQSDSASETLHDEARKQLLTDAWKRALWREFEKIAHPVPASKREAALRLIST